MEHRPLGHLKIAVGTIDDALQFVRGCIERRDNAYAIPINLTKYVVSKDDPKLCAAINGADLVTADGVPIVWLGRRAGHRNVRRITGIDFAERMLDRAAEERWRVCFLGGSPENLRRALESLQHRWPALHIAGSHHGYFQDGSVRDVIGQLNRSRPDVLLIGMGMPQKEYFIFDHRADLSAGFSLTVGGAFDVWAGMKRRTPKVIQRAGFEWLYRSLYDTTRARNIARYATRFAWDLVRYPDPSRDGHAKEIRTPSAASRPERSG